MIRACALVLATLAACHPPDDGGAPPIGTATPNFAFVTSVTYVPAFRADGSDPLSVADTACNQLGYKLGGTYVAWFSTADTPARDRIPAEARGWIRPDGRPVADTLDDWLDGEMFRALTVDENGAPLDPASPPFAATGTRAGGSPGDTCDDWRDTMSGATGGVVSGTTGQWTDAGTVGCGSAAHLYCLGVGGDAEVTPEGPETHRLAFVSEGGFAPGPTTGLAAADAICDAEGTSVRPNKTFAALLATDGATAASRFDAGPGALPWVRPDGQQLAATASDAFAAGHAAINVTLGGDYVDAVAAFGAVDATTPGTDTCADWTSREGATQLIQVASEDWGSLSGDCAYDDLDGSGRLVCLEQ